MAKSIDELISPKNLRQGLDLGPPHHVNSQPVEEMPPPKLLYVPLKQHLGHPCTCKTAVGDTVKIGQVIGESADPDSAPVHAPVSGKVVAVENHPDPQGRMIATVTIENDGADAWLEAQKDDPEFMSRKISAMIKSVRQSGCVLPVSGRPALSMLAPPERPKSYIFLVGIPVIKPINLLVVNAIDPEPTMAARHRRLVESSGELGLAIDLAKKVVGAKNAVLAFDDNVSGNSQAARDAAGEVARSFPVKNRYPVARPELLTTAVTGQEVPWPDGEPRDLGVLVLDIESVWGIYQAIRKGRPQIDRIVSVVGPELTPRNLLVRIGTPLQDVAAYAGGSFEKASKIVVGGLMDGNAQYSPLTPITKETSSICVLGDNDLVCFDEHLCIKCGRCIKVCPMKILPNVITNFCEFGHFAEAADVELFNCIECGCCAYVCPAKRPLVHYIKHGKAEVTAMRAAR